MSVRTLIIEDEAPAYRRLTGLLTRQHPDLEVVDVLDSIAGALRWFAENRPPDLLFSDIQLCDGLSFEIYRQAPPPCPIIFTTAYDEYAIKAFEVNALDYLLKPIEPRRLGEALHKLQAEMMKDNPALAQANRGPLTELDQVFVKDGERCWFVKLGEIRLFESVGNYAKVYFGTNKPLILKSLNALEERLDDRMFFRANRKHIINLRWIEKIEPYFNGGLLVELKGGEKVEVSRRQTVKFKEMMSL